ncbi:MAG: hypothetical protein Q8Q12_07845 [bacterium]|nr:hypothetical protein [bacterium]
MKATIIAAVAAIALVGAFAPAVAQEEPAPQPRQGAVEELRQKFLEERAGILSQILEKRAELVRLSAAEEPDVERVKQLVKEIAELRNEQQEKCAEYSATVGVLSQPDLAPIGRPGAGRMGLGPGPAQRPQWGQGIPRSRWLGQGYGAGRGPAGRPGPGARPWGPGRGFVDRDNDGVCDYWQGFGPGRGRGSYGAPGAGMPWRPGTRMRGLGRGFVDSDNDGVCDYWEDLGNPPRPPVGPPPAEDEQPAPPSEV